MSSKTGAAVSASRPVAETFDEEIAAIKEKGTGLKGDQRDFFQSIMQRLDNNNQVLTDLREEHTQLRQQLGQLIKEKESKSKRVDLDADIKATAHDVNLLKSRIDKKRHERETCLSRQKELEVILANFQTAETATRPEEERIHEIQNHLNKAKIKNGETDHLMKIYNQIIYLLNRQKMYWNKMMSEKKAQIAQKQRDISDLILIERDSRFSRNAAVNEYTQAEKKTSAAKEARDSQLENKKAQVRSISYHQMDAQLESKPAHPQKSLESQPSALRNKINKQQREKREERFRVVSATYDSIREHFGTNDPEKIKQYFTDRHQNTEALNKQIEDLKIQCSDLEKRNSQVRAAIEEAEYASSKGVGGSRLLSEGRRMKSEKSEQLRSARHEMRAFEQHQKSIFAGVAHLEELCSIIKGDEEPPEDPAQALQWILGKIEAAKSALDNEDTDFIELTDQSVLAQYVARADAGFDLEKVDSTKHVRARTIDPLRKPVKENKGDVVIRVKTREEIKAASRLAAIESEKMKKTTPI